MNKTTVEGEMPSAALLRVSATLFFLSSGQERSSAHRLNSDAYMSSADGVRETVAADFES